MAVEFTNEGTIRVINPANLKVLGEVKLTDPKTISETVDDAKACVHFWNERGLSYRLGKIERFKQLLLANREEIAQLISNETGKPMMESLASEIFGVVETCAWLKEKAPKLLRSQKVELNPFMFFGKRSYNIFEPMGVIAVISPWNFPFSISVNSMLTALACGNTVVLKPSPKTPLIGEAIQRLFDKADFPSGVVTVIQGDREQASALVLSDVARVVFTGGVPGGRAIMGLAAQKVHPVTLELGGKHPAIVLGDVDVEKTARAIVWSSFTNSGQACAAVERLYVVKSIAEKLSARIAELTKELNIGCPLDTDTDIGPLIDDDQLQRVKSQVKDAVSKGARVLAGGNERRDLTGYFFEPTVLFGVTDDMDVISQEIFGPILPIVVVNDESEGVRRANNSNLALGASIWTADTKLGEEMATRIQSGMVWINDALYSHIAPDAPWGGLKESGFGRSHSPASLMEFVNIKHIGVDKQGVRNWHFPYSNNSVALINSAMTACHDENIFDRAAAFLLLLPQLYFVRKEKK
ncbi:MAG: aldehyde dehydrogenase family protein [Candidatus Obscuribacterales bacterium]|nr:aldehyde dehydrogenase family protein [Candidatus Obscuribacterales bacterium]